MRRPMLLALVIAASVAAAPAQTQDTFPASVVKLVVPAAAGSTTDTLARLTAHQLTQKWGKPVVVENIAGGAMNIGADRVFRSAPDGHTLLRSEEHTSELQSLRHLVC